jgi:hypothetical protein
MQIRKPKNIRKKKDREGVLVDELTFEQRTISFRGVSMDERKQNM